MDPNEPNGNAYALLPPESVNKIQPKYYLYRDSDKPDLIWYISKAGFVASRGRGSNTRPDFNASATVPSHGIWTILKPDHERVRMGGAFTTAGAAADLQYLADQAASVNLRIAPANVRRTKATLMVEGLDLDGDQRVDVNCIPKTITVEGEPLAYTDCYVTTASGQQVSVEVVDRASFRVPSGRTSSSARIPFQLQTIPDNDNSYAIQTALMLGAPLSGLFTYALEWELDTERETRVARININWNQTFEQASTFAAYHNFACVDVEIQTFFKKLVQEGQGVTVEYYNPITRRYQDTPPNNEQFLKVVDGVRAELEKELFAQINEYSQSQLGQVNTDINAVWTVRANLEKQILKRNESRVVSWNPGMSMEKAQTVMSVDCVEGGFGDTVRWSQEAACQSAIDYWSN